jgi:uncharacterized protein YcfL
MRFIITLVSLSLLVACSTSQKKVKDSDFILKPQEIEKNLEIDDQFLHKSQRLSTAKLLN